MCQAPNKNKLTPDEAQRLAGKMILIASTMFGQVGRAALQPIYARAHGVDQGTSSTQLNSPLKAALRALITLLRELHPRFIPRAHSRDVIVVYTDAYFVKDGQHYSMSSTKWPETWIKSHSQTLENGWGYVIHFQGKTRYGSGRAHQEVLLL